MFANVLPPWSLKLTDFEVELLTMIAGMKDWPAADVGFDWNIWGRDKQQAPDGDWRFWLILAGRGFGKTRTGAEWVKTQVAAGRRRIALIGPTAADVRDVMVEGDSGILKVCPPWDRPQFQSSRRRLVWRNGAMAFLYSAEEPERLRGPQHDAAWADELAAWTHGQETWDQLQFGLRLGDDPRALITTTPKPIPLLRQLMADPNCQITRGTTYENGPNMPRAFLERILGRYKNTRLGRQEIHAEMLGDAPGALWPQETLLLSRVDRHPDLRRVVVAVDPSGSNGNDEGDQQGIVVAGLGVDGLGYVLADRTCRLSPEGWGRRAVEAFDEFGADRLVAEKNYGGDMVRFTLQTVRPTVPVTLVTASRGKVLRAEPVSALYEQGRVRHVIPDPFDNRLADLEAELRQATSNGYLGEGSPNRLDALVWALTDLFLAADPPGSAFLELARRETERMSGRNEVKGGAGEPAPGSVEWLQQYGG